MGETVTDIVRPEEKAKPVVPIQESVIISDVRTEDVVEQFTEAVTKHKAKPVVPVQDSVSVTEVTVEDTTTTFRRGLKTQKAVKTTSTQESVIVSEVMPETVVKEFEDKVDSKTAKRIVSTQESVTISEAQTETTVKELDEKKPKLRKAKVEKKPALEETAKVTEVKPELMKEREEVITKVEEILEKEEKKVAKEVTELMKFVHAKEFGPGESPLRELAKVGYLVRRGVTVNEVMTLYEADRFPSLRTPEAQSAMVHVVEREGHTSLITQVLAEETTTDEAAVAATVGFRAFMRMIELKHANIEEVITHFAPEDFKPHAWETADITEVSIH
ncbi:hypothetical protein PR048_003501 [Dryococelus australis]|uniref:Uncharacterized protein n=1 Tax=Dryococelus australis TaxID=614101 RepID=A0ABQ9IN85_9NEOP|nr:hypothetical protein PR048_003501 [Dryococelus australis]